MKAGERVIWLHSPRHSIVTAWRIQRIPGEIVGFTRQRIRIRAWHRGKERIVRVHPDNVLRGDECHEVTTDFTDQRSFSAKSV